VCAQEESLAQEGYTINNTGVDGNTNTTLPRPSRPERSISIPSICPLSHSIDVLCCHSLSLCHACASYRLANGAWLIGRVQQPQIGRKHVNVLRIRAASNETCIDANNLYAWNRQPACRQCDQLILQFNRCALQSNATASVTLVSYASACSCVRCKPWRCRCVCVACQQEAKHQSPPQYPIPTSCARVADFRPST
jgi:hypothetical protein